MLIHLVKRSLIPLLVLGLSGVMAQNPVRRDSPKSAQIEVLSPKGTNVGQLGLVIYKYTGNVKLRHEGTLLFCDQVTHYVAVNRLEAFGHVLIVQGDTVIVKADTLIYDGNKRQSSLRGHVAFQDRRVSLTASRLNYNLTSGVAHYASRGRLVDGRNVLTSREGYYDSQSKKAELQYAVRLAGPENTLTSDALVYSTVSRMATIIKPTRITGKDGISVAQQGQYDTQANEIQQNTVAAALKYVKLDDPSGSRNNPEEDLTITAATGPVMAEKSTVTSRNTAVVQSAAGKPKVTNEASPKPAAKNSVVAAREPVKKAESATGAVTMVPTPKPDDQVLLATTTPYVGADTPKYVETGNTPSRPIPSETGSGKPTLAKADKAVATIKNPVVEPTAKPATVPAAPKPPVALPFDVAEASRVAMAATAPKPTAPVTTSKTATTNPTVAVNRPVKQPEPVSVVTPAVPAEKPAAPVLVATTNTIAAPLTKTKREAPTTPTVRSEKDALPKTPTPSVVVPQPRPAASVRASAAPAKQVTPDTEESDLERELNRKKRSN